MQLQSLVKDLISEEENNKVPSQDRINIGDTKLEEYRMKIENLRRNRLNLGD